MQRFLPTLAFSVKVVLPLCYLAALAMVWWQRDAILLHLLPQVAFERPEWLWLFTCLPLLWIFSIDSLSGLGPWRSAAALAIRTAVLGLVILALAEVQWVQRSERMTVIYCLDQSLSIPPDQRRAMMDYVVAEVKAHRQAERHDRAGVILFGRQAVVAAPPFEAPLAALVDDGYLELATDATNIAAALKLAQASFREDSARRVVVVSDGNENLGSAQALADQLAAAGIGIDVVPVPIGSPAEVAVEKVTVPVDVRRGQPFDVRVVLHNLTQPTAAGAGVVRGKLKLIRRTGERDETVEQTVEVPPGKKVFTITQEIDSPEFYTYLAEFEPERPGVDDGLTQNNRATAFTHVRGRGSVLLIEDAERPGEFDFLVARLKALNLEVTVQRTDRLFASLAELQKYDSVVLANVPRSGGNDGVTNFSDAQISMLVRNTQQLGAGLVMIGGPASFGAGGWTKTELELAMPVDFQIENAKVKPVGALMLVIDSSGSMDGLKLEMSKAAAQAAADVLGPNDYLGVVAFDSEAHVIQPLQRVGDAKAARSRIGRLAAGGGTNMEPAMREGYRMLEHVPAAVKHMIVLSDGQTSGSGFQRMAADARRRNVTTTGVAIGPDAAIALLNDIATAGGGKYYFVKDPRAVPKIFVSEARRVAMPLVYEDDRGFAPRIGTHHEMLTGLDESLPKITGFVMTTVKDNPLVEVALVSPAPAARHNTVLASWNYGLGRSVCFTSDAGQRWTKEWADWSGYDRLFGQMIRWSMRPVNEEGKFTVALDNRNGRVRVVVTALDQEDQFLNFLDFTTSVVGPDMKAFDVEVAQVAPGRYVGEFEAAEAGSYFVNLAPGPGKAPIRTGVNVAYSPEFLDRETNATLLANMARVTPAGGVAGVVIEGTLSRGKIDERLLATDTFRHNLPKAVSSDAIWPWVIVVAGLAFFGDVLVRRVTVGLDWLLPYVGWLRQRVLGGEALPADERIARLKSKKAEIHEALDQRRAATRFDPIPEPPLAAEVVDAPPAEREGPPAGQALAPLEEAPAASYTERLLATKKKQAR